MQNGKSHKAKKAKTQASQKNDCMPYASTMNTAQQRTVWPDLRFYPVNEEWQRQACNTLALEFVAVLNCTSYRGGPDTILTRPDCRSLKTIKGDGNCLFRALCYYIITGSQQQHFALRSAIVYHMLSFPHLFVGNGPDGQANCITLYSHPR